MRTTLTLDDDVAAVLKRLQKQRHVALKDLVNDALREGLFHLEEVEKAAPTYRSKPVNLGRCLVGSLDCVAEALAFAEGEGFK